VRSGRFDRGAAPTSQAIQAQSDEQQEQDYKRRVVSAKSEDLQTALDEPAAGQGRAMGGLAGVARLASGSLAKLIP
jgi:hypothetical protein